MKRRALSIASLFVISVGILLIVSSAVHAQKPRKLTSTPKAFQTFYAKFKNAVLRGDKEAVASMTSFPFQYGWDAGDEGTYTKRQFLAKYADIFRGTRKLFSQKNPTLYADNGSFSLVDESDASSYVFARRGTTYRFDSFMVEP
jgi:hypothetical protein